MNIFPHNNKGFSFIELMITIAIIGILATVSTVSFVGHVKKTSIKTAQTTCGLIAASLVQTHNSGISITANNWSTLGITDPSDQKWTYTFPALASATTMSTTYAITATGISGKVKNIVCLFKPKATGSNRWTVN